MILIDLRDRNIISISGTKTPIILDWYVRIIRIMVRVTLLSPKITQPMISLLKLILRILLFLASLSLCIYVCFPFRKVNQLDSFSIFITQSVLPLSLSLFLVFLVFFPMVSAIPFNPVQSRSIVLPLYINFILHMEYRFIKMVSELGFEELCCASLFLSFFFPSRFVSFLRFPFLCHGHRKWIQIHNAC